ncbi:hypothetical protein [Paraburkholderia sp. BL17N1]|nr:hypothetical protein [Paraburkholderia sp. BL17N1]
MRKKYDNDGKRAQAVETGNPGVLNVTHACLEKTGRIARRAGIDSR